MELISYICIALCFLIILVIIESIREIRQLRITEYNISHSKIPKEFIGYKVILMSDFHNCFYNRDKIIQTIMDEKPNAVIIAGDMLVFDKREKKDNIRSLEIIRDISRYSDVYYAPGNHEMGYMIKKNHEWLEYERYLLDSEYDNIYYLDNKHIELFRGDSAIRIYGLHLTDGYYKRFIKKKLTKEDINSLLEAADESYYNILVAHNPDYFMDYCSWGANLILSGHNHGGLVNIPLIGGVISPRLRLFPRYDYGLYERGESKLVLSGGLGAHSLKIRVNNVPELVILNFTKQ